MPKGIPLIEDRLRLVARRASVRDRKTIQQAIVELESLGATDDDVFDLKLRMNEIEKWRLQEHAKYTDAENCVATDLLATAKCLREITRFLDRHAPSKSLRGLEVAFVQLALGGPAAPLLKPVKTGKGRRPDSARIVSAKGAVAGLTASKQREGLTRKQAARWIASNMSLELSRRLAGKKITTSLVEEWLGHYGGKHPPDDAGGEAYKWWIQPGVKPNWLTKPVFLKIADHLAESLPPRDSD